MGLVSSFRFALEQRINSRRFSRPREIVASQKNSDKDAIIEIVVTFHSKVLEELIPIKSGPKSKVLTIINSILGNTKLKGSYFAHSWHLVPPASTLWDQEKERAFQRTKKRKESNNSLTNTNTNKKPQPKAKAKSTQRSKQKQINQARARHERRSSAGLGISDPSPRVVGAMRIMPSYGEGFQLRIGHRFFNPIRVEFLAGIRVFRIFEALITNMQSRALIASEVGFEGFGARVAFLARNSRGRRRPRPRCRIRILAFRFLLLLPFLSSISISISIFIFTFDLPSGLPRGNRIDGTPRVISSFIENDRDGMGRFVPFRSALVEKARSAEVDARAFEASESFPYDRER